MTELQIPVWMEDFNGSGQITSDWKMWHNGYDRHLLKDFFVENYPDILQHQTLREISSPMFPGEPARDHFCLVDLYTNQGRSQTCMQRKIAADALNCSACCIL